LRLLAAVYNALVLALAVAAGAIIAAMCLLIVVDVTIRSLGVRPPSFTIAVVEYSLLYITMFAAPYLVRHKNHVFIDALVSRLPVPLAAIIARIIYLIAIAAALVVAYFSGQLLFEAIASGLYEERGIDIPLWTLYLPMPLGFVLVAIEFARYLFGFDSMYRDYSATEGSL
jgi:TRAP-type C4-dicarboxylate transport system permease small subunit